LTVEPGSSSSPLTGTGSKGRPQVTPRRTAILTAAVELFRTQGFHAVGVDDIGRAAGISGPGIYRHFPNKGSLLVAIFDLIGDQMLRAAEEVAELVDDPVRCLERLIDYHIDFAIEDRALIAVFIQEERSLPEPDRRRIRLRQRRYLDHWVDDLVGLHGIDRAEAVTLLYAAIGFMCAPAFYRVPVDDDRARAILGAKTRQMLLGPPV
jgi:AcrR family transcriptional regulator